LNPLGNKVGRWLARAKFVRRAIEEKANLQAFRKPPTLGIFTGIFLVCFSFVICWPAISVLSGLSIYFRKPLIVCIGGPLLYGFSHVCFIAGMALSGGVKYPYIFLRWCIRMGVEKLLAGGTDGE
jgi:hypothetical protein